MAESEKLETYNTIDEIPLDIIEACKKEIQSQSIQKKFICIKFKYYEYVLPYLEGLDLLKVLKNIEYINNDSYSFNKIEPLNEESKISIRFMDLDTYTTQKMRTILKIQNPGKDE